MSLVRILVLLLAVSVVPARAQQAANANLDILRDTIRANKKALVAVNLNLTDAEATQFWPLYERYQQEMNAVGDRVLKLVQDYSANFKTLDDQKASQLVGDYLSAEEDRAKVRRTFLPEFQKVLPGKKVARFYQIENKIDAVLRYDLAAEIPVVEQ